jgi:hypothetical protein
MALSFRRLFVLPAGAALATVLVTSSAFAQAAPPKPPAGHGAMDHSAHGKAEAKEEDHAKSGWAELDTFHDVMSAAWHPAKNDTLAPARASSDKLVAAAKAWNAAKVPMGCEAPAVKTGIAKLVPESEAVAKLVASKAPDATLKAALKTVHDTYHVVEAACKPMKH